MRGRGEVHLGQYTQFSEYFQTCSLPHFLWSFQALPGLGHWPIFPPSFPHGPAKGVLRTVQNSPALQERLLGLAHRLQSRIQLVLEQLRFKLCRFNSTWFFFFFFNSKHYRGLPSRLSGKEPTCPCRRPEFHPWIRKIPWRRKWLPTPVFLPGEFHGQRSLVGYGPSGLKRVRHN